MIYLVTKYKTHLTKNKIFYSKIRKSLKLKYIKLKYIG